MDRREKLRLEAIQEAERIKRETQERRTKRANLKEKLRIHKIEKTILDAIIGPAPLNEWKPNIPVRDLRRYISEPPYETNVSQASTKSPTSSGSGCIYVLGGMIGEMVVALNCLQTAIRTKADQSGFYFSQQDLETYFMSCFSQEQGYPAGTVMLEFLSNPEMVKVDPENAAEAEAQSPKEVKPEAEEGSVYEEQPLSNEDLTEFAMNPTNLGSFGLKIIIENQQELDFDHELVRRIFQGIISVARHQVRVEEQRPMSPAEVSASQEGEDVEGSEHIKSQASLARSKSEVDRNMLQALNDLKEKFKIVYRTDEQAEQQRVAEEETEKCLIKINNYREETNV